MFLRKSYNKNTGRTFLSIIHGYRDADGIPRQKTMMAIGYLDELEKTYSDPTAFFQGVAKQMTLQHNRHAKPVELKIDTNAQMSEPADGKKNFGYAALSKIYHSLNLDKFIHGQQQKMEFNVFDPNAILKTAVYSRLLFTGENMPLNEGRKRFFETMDFSTENIYQMMDYVSKNKSAMKQFMVDRASEIQTYDISLSYYVITNYYVMDDSPSAQSTGSEEIAGYPVQLRLLVSSNKLPMYYELIKQSIPDRESLFSKIEETPCGFALGRRVIVANANMTENDDVSRLSFGRNDYLFSYSIKDAREDFISFMLDDSDYEQAQCEAGMRYKSRVIVRTVVDETDGEQMRVREKQIAIWSFKKAQQDHSARVEAMRSANDVKVCAMQDERLDGYEAIATSLVKLDDEQLIMRFRSINVIERQFVVTHESFSIEKVDEGKFIDTHFFICFASMVVITLLRSILGDKYTVEQIKNSLRKMSCCQFEENYYLFYYYDELLRELGEKLGIDFARRYRTLGEIKRELARTKKRAPRKKSSGVDMEDGYYAFSPEPLTP